MGTFTKEPKAAPQTGPYSLIEDPFKEGTDAAQKARLYEESVGFDNLADNPFVRDQARQAVTAGLKDVFNVMEFLRNKWLILYRLYRGETLDRFAYGRTRLHSPEPYKAVETFHPKIMRALFANDRWFKLYGQHQDNDENAKCQEILCRDQLRAARFMQKASNHIRDGLIYGTAIQKTYWLQKHGDMRYRTGKRVPRKNGMGSEVKLTEVKKRELIFDGNTTENVSIFDFLTSPNASGMDDAEWAADRSSWPDWKVKRMGELGHWINLAQLREHPGTNDTSFGDEFKERKSYAYGVFDPREASWAPHIPHYEVIDWWGPLVISDKNGNYETKMCNVVMVEPESLQLVVRVTQNPFWHQQLPYQAWRPITLEDEFYGIGALEMIARLSLEKDMKRNLLMAASQLEANPMLLVADDANIPDGQLLAQPGLVLRVPDPQKSVVPLAMPQVSDSALKAENIITGDIRETTGATSPSMGVGDPFNSDKTATQHMSEVDESNMRLVPMIFNYEEGIIKPMLDQMTWNNQQFQSYAKVVREVGPMGMKFHDRYEIRPEDLIGRFLVQPLAGHRLTTKQTQVQQLVNILDRAPIINQMYGPNAVKMPQLLAMILEYGFDIRNVDEFITVPQDSAGLLTPSEEEELWFHGNVPPRKPDDNDMRHILSHMTAMGKERFSKLEEVSPGTAARARAHVAEHYRKVELLQLQQEKTMMEFAQMAAQTGMSGGGNGSPVAGAGGPGQEPGSPKVRNNETERGEGSPSGGNEAKSSAGRQAPNRGAE